MPRNNDSDRKSLAFELLGMSYGDTISFAECLSEILTSQEIETNNPQKLAAALYDWAKAENEKPDPSMIPIGEHL